MGCKNRSLRSLIYKKYDTESEMARAMGWPKQRLNKITNGQKIPNVNELDDLAVALDEPIGEVAHLFLPK